MSDPMTPEGRAELRALLSKSAPTPWWVNDDGFWRDDPVIQQVRGDKYSYIAKVLDGSDPEPELICEAVNALPVLLDALDQADRHERELLRGAGLIGARSLEVLKECDAAIARAEKAEAALERAKTALAEVSAHRYGWKQRALEAEQRELQALGGPQ